MTKWDERYQQGEHLNDKPHPLVVELAAKLKPGRVLDVACGVGRHALYLAERGWQVTAVDSSKVAIELLRERANKLGLQVDARVADLETGEFIIAPNQYDLIVNCCYLQRDLFAAIKAGTKIGGVVLVVIPMVDNDPAVKPMNPAFLLLPEELRAQFADWELLHDVEGKPVVGRRAMAEIVARRK
ncbi:MAG: methyltransferase domain-containing protein [Acidobacteria bacterium]|nr:methyltransferase domain-containing protein [Acidobacteriota bacterium]